MGGKRISRRKFIQGASAAAAAGALLPACGNETPAADSGPDGLLDGDPWPDGDLTPDGDVGPDGDTDDDVLPEDGYADRRVVRVYDRRVTSYGFEADEACWQAIDPNVLREMLERGLVELARQPSIAAAWRALLPGDLGSAAIAIKVNMNGDDPGFINTSPAMVIALAGSLIDAGASAERLTFFDCSRAYHEPYREAIRAVLPDVVLLGGGEVELHETEIITASSMLREDATAVTVPAPVCLVEADHLLNVHMLKGHFGGATGAMKNLFGLARNVGATFHGSGASRYELGSQCADLAAEPLVRSRSRLLISEGVYGTWWHANKPPDRFRNADLFPDGLPCTLTLSRNPLYHDTVLYDLLAAERDYAPLGEGYDTYPDDWLEHCAGSPYELGDFAHATLIEGTFTARDLAYGHIDYRSLSTEA